jgi:hypothetical protein
MTIKIVIGDKKIVKKEVENLKDTPKHGLSEESG